MPNKKTDKRPLPEGLLGVLFDDKRGFVCTKDLTDDDDIDDESKATVILDYDEWFTGEECSRCHELIERKV